MTPPPSIPPPLRREREAPPPPPRSGRGLGAGALLVIVTLATYLSTAGGHAYSTDGTFAFEMAKSAVLDPDHQYWGRFRTAFARWGVAMPVLGQPLVLAGAAIAAVAPERDDLVVDGHRFRVEDWPAVRAGIPVTFPPADRAGDAPGTAVRAITVVSYLANAANVAQGATVAEVRLDGPDGQVTIPVRAGIETAEWAWDRPDMRGAVAHQRGMVAGQWVGQPRGNLYVARLVVDPPMPVTSWGAAGRPSLGTDGTWEVRAAAFEMDAVPGATRWRDVRTGERTWSERQSRDFWAQLGFSLANAIVTALATGMTWRLAGALGAAVPVRIVVAAGYAFATIAWPYAKFDFSEPLAALAILVAADAILRAFPPGAASGFPVPGGIARPAATTAVACLIAVAAKYAAAFAVAALAVEWLVVARPWAGPPARRRRALAFGAAVAAPALALGAIAGAILLRATGETPILLTSGIDRLRDDWLTLPIGTGLRGLLTSSGKGLAWHSPWLLLALPGIALLVLRAWRDRDLPDAARGLVMAVAYPVLTVLAYAHKLAWHGGAWGPRYLLLALPWIALAALPAISWLWARRAGRTVLAILGAVSVLVQLLAIAKHPEQFSAMARRHVLAALPRFGADLGGRDYWDARGGDLLGRALRDPASGTARARSLGYLWGYPDATATIRFRTTTYTQVALYAVDWDRQGRSQVVAIEDALGTRTIDLDSDLARGVWVVTTVRADPDHPLVIRLHQTGPDTAVLSAVAFDPVAIGGNDTADPRALRLDRETAGDWPGRYGADGRVFFAFRSFNIDEARLPGHVAGYDLAHVGDRPNPTIHVEIAEDDLLDTAILYAPPFAPLAGNAWLVAADLLHLLVPSRPDLAGGVLIRPPWHWFGVDAPHLDHPEYGLGLDFWPTIIWSNYASHRTVIGVAATVLVVLETTAVLTLARLLAVGGAGSRARSGAIIAAALGFAAYDTLMVLP